MRVERLVPTSVPPEAVPTVDIRKLRELALGQMATRFALGAAVSIVAGILSKTVGARFGGVFLAFPAILPASLTFIQDKEGTRTAERDALGAVLGGLALVGFAAVGESMFSRHNSALVIALALLAWLVTSFVLYSVLTLIRPDRSAGRGD